MRNALVLLLVVLSVGIAFALLRSSSDDEGGAKTVSVERGGLSVDAVAVGKVEAAYEVPVKSTTGGVLTRRFVALGQLVAKGDPLCEVRPVLTDQQKLQAERALLGATEAEEGAMELSSGETIAGATMRFFQGVKSAERLATGAERARSDAEKQLELLLNGSAEIDGMTIDYIIRAPIDGRVIALDLEVGEPVVPSSSFGSGTDLVVLADLDHPIFRGTIDEIEVGRLREGMGAKVTIGARPDLALEATLKEISLKAETQNNAVVFPVELTVEPPEGLVMRSGYSAVARIRIDEVTDALLLPERVVEFREGSAFVLIPGDGDGEPREVEVQVGLSDSLRIEIRDGL
ncbi:MAG TPA: HlyD family efflux transporter periplasmic adaptor subunit, partial [Planctomycetaceae bacterium]|nr:HlyD family efflux transporter periplasmic adaptor subunit [Planctomycetaceae bacterium]